MLNLKALKECAEKATPGPWKYAEDDGVICDDEYDAVASPHASDTMHLFQQMDNAAYIALANPSTILSLIERCEELEGALTIASKPTCFACGALCIEACKRADMSSCGREHLGGTRAPLSVSDGVTDVLDEFGWLTE